MKIVKKNIIYFAVITFFFLCNFFVKNAYATGLENGDTLSLDNYEVNQLDISSEENKPFGVAFNNDGTKMFMVGEGSGTDSTIDDIHEYILSTPYDTSTATFRVGLNANGVTNRILRQIQFNKDGSKMFVSGRDQGQNPNGNKVYQYSLSTNFDLSTATFNEIEFQANTANVGITKSLYGFAFNNDGTMMFLSDGSTDGTSTEKVYQLSLETAFDLSGSITVIRSVDLEALQDTVEPVNGETEPSGIAFNQDGTRMFLIGQKGNDVNQYTLSVGFNISTASFDGGLNLDGNPNGIALSPSGLKMFTTSDTGFGDLNGDLIREFDLPCPFSLFAGGCSSITENKDRTGMALAQIEIAKRTIDYSTDTALNRLKWIRRNKDKQNLTNLNIGINLNNQILASLTEAVKIAAANYNGEKNKNKLIAGTIKKKNKEEDIFYWSEGSISIGRIGDTSISSTKIIDTDALTFGADKFTDNNGIKGLAFRIGKNNVDVGTAGSNLDTDTYNITYYATSPIEGDTKFLDKIIGLGKLNSDLLTVVDGNNLKADRSGHQIYGTIRVKDEIKKDNITYIPSGRFDIGHTILGSYQESGSGAIDVEKQHIRSKKIRAGLTGLHESSHEGINLKRHGKLEYVADIDRSSNFKYSYVGDHNNDFNETLHSGSLHNINGEVGIDVTWPNSLSIFLIYERLQALDYGHTDKIHIAIGYLPNKKTNYSFSLKGSDEFKSNYILSKNINDYVINFQLINDLMKLNDFDKANFNLIRKF